MHRGERPGISAVPTSPLSSFIYLRHPGVCLVRNAQMAQRKSQWASSVKGEAHISERPDTPKRFEARRSAFTPHESPVLFKVTGTRGGLKVSGTSPRDLAGGQPRTMGIFFACVEKGSSPGGTVGTSARTMDEGMGGVRRAETI